MDQSRIPRKLGRAIPIQQVDMETPSPIAVLIGNVQSRNIGDEGGGTIDRGRRGMNPGPVGWKVRCGRQMIGPPYEIRSIGPGEV